MIPPAVLVGLGGVCGAVGRYLVGELLEGARRDTLAVNVAGSFALGAVLALPVGESATLLVGTGFCGAFTTFSSFAVETVQLYEQGDRREAVVYAGGTLLAALVAVTAGGMLAGAV